MYLAMVELLVSGVPFVTSKWTKSFDVSCSGLWRHCSIISDLFPMEPSLICSNFQVP